MRAFKLFAIVLFTATAARAQFIKAELQISGLNCALCAKTTAASLKALPFVSDVKPDLMHNAYNITFKSNQPVNFDEIGKVVKDENFFVNSLKATFNFDNVKVTDNYFSYGGQTYRIMNNAGKPLNGPVVITIVDKGLAPRSVSKKYLGQVAIAESVKSGRLYHVAI